MITGFSHYLKVELSSEIFCKLKWSKVRKQLPFTIVFPDPPPKKI